MKTFSPNPAAFASLVEPAADSIVSRVLFRNGGCTITGFAFAEGEGLSEHAAAQDAILLILEGELSITLGTENHRMSAGDLLHIPAGRSHTLHPGPAFQMLLILARDATPGTEDGASA